MCKPRRACLWQAHYCAERRKQHRQSSLHITHPLRGLRSKSQRVRRTRQTAVINVQTDTRPREARTRYRSSRIIRYFKYISSRVWRGPGALTRLRRVQESRRSIKKS